MKILFIIAGIVFAIWFFLCMFIAIKTFNKIQREWKKSEKISEEMIKIKRQK